MPSPDLTNAAVQDPRLARAIHEATKIIESHFPGVKLLVIGVPIEVPAEEIPAMLRTTAAALEKHANARSN